MARYFDIDDIAASNERIPCSVSKPLVGLGYLDASTDSRDVATGTKLDLPLWLARELLPRGAVEAELPKPYRQSYREILKADASVVDLQSLGPHFYAVGLKLLDLIPEEGIEVSNVLLQTFRVRFKNIMDVSQNACQENMTCLTMRMDAFENDLFNQGQQTLQEIQRWEWGGIDKLPTSQTILNQRKRKHNATAL